MALVVGVIGVGLGWILAGAQVAVEDYEQVGALLDQGDDDGAVAAGVTCSGPAGRRAARPGRRRRQVEGNDLGEVEGAPLSAR